MRRSPALRTEIRPAVTGVWNHSSIELCPAPAVPHVDRELALVGVDPDEGIRAGDATDKGSMEPARLRVPLAAAVPRPSVTAISPQAEVTATVPLAWQTEGTRISLAFAKITVSWVKKCSPNTSEAHPAERALSRSVIAEPASQ
jgi:hypothetical protein